MGSVSALPPHGSERGEVRLRCAACGQGRRRLGRRGRGARWTGSPGQDMLGPTGRSDAYTGKGFERVQVKGSKGGRQGLRAGAS